MEINGITLKKYAQLCALMAHTNGDEAQEIEIAKGQGVEASQWLETKKSFTAKMSDPSDMGKTALAFMPLYQAAQEKMRGGGEPCSLEVYTKVHAHMAFRKDPNQNGEKIDYQIVLEENGFNHQHWIECEAYWTPRVSDSSSPKFDQGLAQSFAEILQDETNKII